MNMDQLREKRRRAAIEAMKQARDSVEKAFVMGKLWYVLRLSQGEAQLEEMGAIEEDPAVAFRDDPEWQRDVAKIEALERLYEAVEDAAVAWLNRFETSA